MYQIDPQARQRGAIGYMSAAENSRLEQRLAGLPKTFALGTERFEAAPGETIPKSNVARSVVDAMRRG